MGNHNIWIKTVLMIAGIIEILAGLAHFPMPHFVYQSKGFSLLNQNEIHLVTLCVFAVGILLIAFGAITISFVLKVDASNELHFIYASIKSLLWLARIILEIIYPIKISLFFIEKPTTVIMPLLIIAFLLFVFSAVLIVLNRKKIIVEKVDVPHEALADYEFGPLNYVDAYRVKLSVGSKLSMSELAHQVLGKTESYPAYVRFLLRLRDFLVKPLGLYTAADMKKIEDRSDWIGFFRIYRRSEDEIIIGGDDKHLDVRVSLLRTVDNDKPFLTVSTFVRFNNLLGKFYFTVIKRFHRVIVPDTVKRALERLLKNEH